MDGLPFEMGVHTLKGLVFMYGNHDLLKYVIQDLRSYFIDNLQGQYLSR